eukprot:TCONS_00030440-protein
MMKVKKKYILDKSSKIEVYKITRKIKMQDMLHELENIEHDGDDASAATPKGAKMDDLLQEMKRLSAKYKEDDELESSNKEEYEYPSVTSTKKAARKRQKRRKQNNRNRKRRLKNQADYELASSSFTDCTDEDIIKDYIENITTNLSDSEVEVTLRKGMFLARRDLKAHSNISDRLSPDVYEETDSLSESLLLTQSRKKRRKYKKHSFEDFGGGLSTNTVTLHQKFLIQKCLKQQYSKNLERVKIDHTSMVLDEDIDEQQNQQEQSQISDNSESSSNSHLGSDADDEGGESCWEGPATRASAIQKVIPWWEEENESESGLNNQVGMDFLNGVSVGGCGDIEEELRHEMDLSLVRNTENRPDLKTRLKQYENDMFCESGWFAAYANHKIRKFILNRDTNELTLYPSCKREQEQVEQLSMLYNLQHSIERKNHVALTKTLFSKEADQDALKTFLGNIVRLKRRKIHRSTQLQWNNKRRKVISQNSFNDTNLPASFNAELNDIPIPNSNVGNQMLRGMGWKPGQGLGKDNTGQVFPVKATKRPRNLGFGHPSGMT